MSMRVPKMATSYKPKSFTLSGLAGISDQTLEMHFKLYEGYVKETNQLTERIAEFLRDGRVAQDEMLVHAELTRRLGFEYNGMILHELYFENMRREGGGQPRPGTPLRRAVEASFGTWEVWKAHFAATGAMRGVGWAICYQNPESGALSNHWITLHETGHVAGFHPIVVMDVWEHAYLLDYAPADRDRYVEAFFSNVAWEVAEARLQRPTS